MGVDPPNVLEYKRESEQLSGGKDECTFMERMIITKLVLAEKGP